MTGQHFNEQVGQVIQADTVNQVLHVPEKKPESQLQSEFAQRTGIWCPRHAREIFEWLMEHHGFTAKELRIAWKANSVLNDAERQSVKIITPALESVFAWFMAAFVSLYFLFFAFPLAMNGSRHDWRVAVTLAGGVVVYFGLMWVIAHNFLIPRRIAVRVRKKMELL